MESSGTGRGKTSHPTADHRGEYPGPINFQTPETAAPVGPDHPEDEGSGKSSSQDWSTTSPDCITEEDTDP